MMAQTKKSLKLFQVGKNESECLELISECTSSLNNLNPDIKVVVGEIQHVPFMNSFRCKMIVTKVKAVTWYQCKQALLKVKPVSFDLI